ncbi:type II secretion system F family protein [Helicobacter sp. 11S02596-1]|uniref:type II secretion system F family protein n=1 Tax=Helicobacter sp. 11S02596-1 TaxID=1476194 RepID=UPI000BA68389|nr:type II secretion system F family protein [Helicobacter sp. 11S02596-1]PAF43633.1 hypothetical protein BJI48_05095 [Helicobacter sp. 11S02596-1]
MAEFYLLVLCVGWVFLLLGIRLIVLHKKAKTFMQIVDVYYPDPNKASDHISLSGFVLYHIAYFFRNVYVRGERLNPKGLLITFLSMIACVIANMLFLQFSVLIAIALGVILGAYIANSLHTRKIKTEFENTFPEALVILSGAISSGSNLTQALQDCSHSIDGVLSKELKLVTRSLSVGDDPAKVFAASFRRLPFSHYYFFLTTILVSMKSGAKIKEVLSRLSTALTKAKSMEKKKEAITSEVRMSSKITAAIPFCFLILMKFISPDNFDYIMHNPSGRYILYYFLTSEGIGMLIIMFLMRKL